MPVDSLLDIARRAMARYANAITDIGDLPYELVKSALLKIDSPERLHTLEKKSPQIIGHDRECWINFLKRDIPNWQSKPHEPTSPELWYKAYKKLKKEADDEMSKGEDALKAAFAGLKEDREKNTSNIVQSVLSRPKKKSGWGPSVRNMTLIDKIKHQTRETHRVQKNIQVRQKQMQRAPTVVTAAPQTFLEHARRQAASPPPAQPSIRAPRARESRPPMHAPTATRPRRPDVTEEYNIIRDREARLQALKRKKPDDESEGSNQPNATSPNAGTSRPGDSEKPQKLSSRFLEDLEDGDEPADRTKLKPPGDRPRSASPARIASPKPVLKRKPAPSLFMSTKKPMLKRPAVK